MAPSVVKVQYDNFVFKVYWKGIRGRITLNLRYETHWKVHASLPVFKMQINPSFPFLRLKLCSWIFFVFKGLVQLPIKTMKRKISKQLCFGFLCPSDSYVKRKTAAHRVFVVPFRAFLLYNCPSSMQSAVHGAGWSFHSRSLQANSHASVSSQICTNIHKLLLLSFQPSPPVKRCRDSTRVWNGAFKIFGDGGHSWCSQAALFSPTLCERSKNNQSTLCSKAMLHCLKSGYMNAERKALVFLIVILFE